MADYFTHFSCLLDVGTPENAVRALELLDGLLKADSPEEPLYSSLLASIEPAPNGTKIWIRDDDNGDVEAVIEYVKLCGAKLGLTGRWGFQYANTCSKPRLDAFGGGAHVLDLATGEQIGWVDTDTWLTIVLDGGNADA